MTPSHTNPAAEDKTGTAAAAADGFDPHEIDDLTEAVIETRLTPSGRDRLEELVRTSAAARRRYVQRLALHAALRWSAGGLGSLGESRAGSGGVAGVSPPGNPDAGAVGIPRGRRFPRLWAGRSRRWATAGLAAAGLAAAVGLATLGSLVGWPPGFSPAPARQPDTPTIVAALPVATLTDTISAKWTAANVPTEQGARLPVGGRLRLAEGIIRLTFDVGATLTVEAPADLEILSAHRCRLAHGRLVARVGPSAVGFTVDTPTGQIEDLGTEFGLHVSRPSPRHPGGHADIQVFEGAVDARHPLTGEVRRVLSGQQVRLAAMALCDSPPGTEAHLPPPEPDRVPLEPGHRMVTITTATGTGRDAYVMPASRARPMPAGLLGVKFTTPDAAAYSRKAYLAFDLTPLRGREPAIVRTARLTLTFAPTGLGLASEVPDATFAVYGLTDQALDTWRAESLTWDNAPANLPDGDRLDPHATVLLGTFVLPQGTMHATVTVGGPAMADFLNADINGTATIIVLRKTPGSGRGDLVHGFAGRQHPNLPPPILRLTVTDPPRP